MILIHGDNLTASRDYLHQLLNQAKAKKQEIIKLDGQKIDLTSLQQALVVSSLFGQEKLIVIENLFSRPTSLAKEKIIKFLSQFSEPPFLIIWEGKTVNLGILKKFGPKLKIKAFKIPALIFQFLDAFFPGNQKNLLRFHQLLKNQPAELLFFLLIKRLSQLIIVQDLRKEALSSLAPWQQAKIFSQAQKFDFAKLKKCYQNLLSIEEKIKTGKTLAGLDWHLDFFLANL